MQPPWSRDRWSLCWNCPFPKRSWSVRAHCWLRWETWLGHSAKEETSLRNNAKGLTHSCIQQWCLCKKWCRAEWWEQRGRRELWLKQRATKLSRKFPVARWSTTLIQFLISEAAYITQMLRKIFLHTQKVPWHQVHWSRFRHCRHLFRNTFQNSLGHDTLLSVWKKMAERKHREIHDVQRKKKMVQLTTCEAYFA